MHGSCPAEKDETLNKRLAMLALIVPDYDEGIAFFTETLGFSLIADEDQGSKRWVVVRPPQGGSDILLARATGASQDAAIGQQGAGRVWLFLSTDDFAADHKRMSQAGVHFEEAPRHEPYGIVAVFRDPWGNRWDLLQPN